MRVGDLRRGIAAAASALTPAHWPEQHVAVLVLTATTTTTTGRLSVSSSFSSYDTPSTTSAEADPHHPARRFEGTGRHSHFHITSAAFHSLTEATGSEEEGVQDREAAAWEGNTQGLVRFVEERDSVVEGEGEAGRGEGDGLGECGSVGVRREGSR